MAVAGRDNGLRRESGAEDRPGRRRGLPHRDARVRRTCRSSTSGTPTSTSTTRSPGSGPSCAKQGSRSGPRSAGQGPHPGQHAGAEQADHHGRRRRRIISDPPLIVPLEELFADVEADALYALLASCSRATARPLQADRRHLLEQFSSSTWPARSSASAASAPSLDPAARGRRRRDPLFLQAKEAQRSVLADYAGRSGYRTRAQRVVAGQHLMQAASDIFLGWQRSRGPDGAERDFYVRQLRDWKDSVDDRGDEPDGMTVYGGCAAGPWPGRTPAPATGSRSPPTSARPTRSTRRWPTSPRPTPTRTSATTRRWPTRSPPGACKPRWASRPPAGPDRRPNTDTDAAPPANDADTPGLTARRWNHPVASPSASPPPRATHPRMAHLLGTVVACQALPCPSRPARLSSGHPGHR